MISWKKGNKIRTCVPAAVLVVLVFFVCIPVMTACKGQGDPAASDVVEFVQKVSANRADAIDIYIIVKNHDSKYWQELCAGVEDAGLEMDCNIFVGGTKNETNAAGQMYLVDCAYEAGADVLLLAPIASDDMPEHIRCFRDDNIPVILVDTIANNIDFDTCFMTDNLRAGKMAAQTMIEKLEEAGYTENDSLQVGIQIGSDTSQTILERLAGFYEYWNKYAPVRWTILDHIDCNSGDIEIATRLAEEMLTDHIEVRGVVGLNNGSTVGLCNCLRKFDRKDIVLVGFDLSDEMIGMIQDGYPADSVVQQQHEMGYLGVMEGLNILSGQEPPYRLVDTEVMIVNNATLEQYLEQ